VDNGNGIALEQGDLVIEHTEKTGDGNPPNTHLSLSSLSRPTGHRLEIMQLSVNV